MEQRELSESAGIELGGVFAEVGKKYGYPSATAEYTAFKEFKIRWQRTYGHIEFSVSDYLEGAPAGVLADLAHCLFGKIKGDDGHESTGDLEDFVCDDAFSAANQGKFLRRSKGSIGSAGGEHVDLDESYRRLVDAGLLAEIPNLRLTWAKHPIRGKSPSFSSTLMRVVFISPELDVDDPILGFLADYAVYRECARVSMAREAFGDYDNHDFSALDAKHPRHADAVRIFAEMEKAGGSFPA